MRSLFVHFLHNRAPVYGLFPKLADMVTGSANLEMGVVKVMNLVRLSIHANLPAVLHRKLEIVPSVNNPDGFCVRGLPPFRRVIFFGVLIDAWSQKIPYGVQSLEQRFFVRITLAALVQKALQAFEKLHRAERIQRLPVSPVQVYIVFKHHLYAVSLPVGVNIQGQHGVRKALCTTLFLFQPVRIQVHDFSGQLVNTFFFHNPATHGFSPMAFAPLPRRNISPAGGGRLPFAHAPRCTGKNRYVPDCL
jgi:hypothetical protein